ncbi:activin receptor type-2B [Tetranychus urticae]|uniref:activin receptor type-2B n=1 Tax=Tetranychus urticae TaxID=32264 RepID=UPI00077BACFF|nr:activin receptor type-2B [Tetranychus urticae]XP_015785018.1 activin receptor type-2B [Tetranychus urticae]
MVTSERLLAQSLLLESKQMAEQSSTSSSSSSLLSSLQSSSVNSSNHSPNLVDVDLKCSFYNETVCATGNCNTDSSVVKCAQDLTNTGSEKYCYSLWSNSSSAGEITIKYKGCLTGHNYDCTNSTKCIASRVYKGIYFCCCSEDLCNNDVYLLSDLHEYSPQQSKPTEIPESGSIWTWSYTLAPLLVLIFAILIVLYYFWFKKRKGLARSKRYCEDEESVPITNQMNGLGNCTNMINGNLSAGGNLNASKENGNRTIHLIEKLSTGRFGSVWKAKMFYNNKDDVMREGGTRRIDEIKVDEIEGDNLITTTDYEEKNNYQIVAVKVFPPHERSSWIIEQLVFKTPQIEHENILRFIGSEKRDDSNNVPLSASPSGFWLITEYHELGSLCDYLKQNTVNIDELLKISIGMAAGLNHLHYEIPENKSDIINNIGNINNGSNSSNGFNSDNGDVNYNMKPSIVHRDFKSRNVLLKPDLTPRIADFGLALIFYPNRTPAGLGQVGTRRYMAPEVLEGAINYSQDSLYRIDIYALALVLWELVSRCRLSNDIGAKSDEKDDDLKDNYYKVRDYKLPFEEEVGHNPSLEDMQEVVCQEKKRPIIEKQWLDHPILKVICETIEECWDQDAEARLSASCILERLTILARNRVNTRV